MRRGECRGKNERRLGKTSGYRAKKEKSRERDDCFTKRKVGLDECSNYDTIQQENVSCESVFI